MIRGIPTQFSDRIAMRNGGLPICKLPALLTARLIAHASLFNIFPVHPTSSYVAS
jgi:hypothetical protein